MKNKSLSSGCPLFPPFSPLFPSDSLGNGLVDNTSYTSRGMLKSLATTTPITTQGSPATGNVMLAGSEQSHTIPATAGSGSVTIAGTELSRTVTTEGPPCRIDPDTGLETCTTRTTTTYDSGTVTVTVNGHPDSAPFGIGSSASGISSAFVNTINGDAAAVVNASISSCPSTTPPSCIITLTPRSAAGQASNFPLSASATSSMSSFSATASGPSLTNGQDAQITYDSGIVSIMLNGESFSYNYGGSDTVQSIGDALASKLNGSGLVDAGFTLDPPPAQNQGHLSITTIAQNASADYALSASSSTSNPGGYFSAPSFTPTPSGSALTGGVNPVGGTNLYSFSLGLAPDGAITGASDSVNGNWLYGYDQFNRLASSSNSTAPAQSFTYDYDRYGNRWHQNAPQGGPAPQYAMDNATNRISGSGVTYDALGNVTNDGLGNSFTYDAENRLVKVVNASGTFNYAYDADGRRVSNGIYEFFYDLSGRVAEQFLTSNGVPSHEMIYAGARHLATYSAAVTSFMHADWLGTKRLMTTLSGTNAVTCTGLPFGDGQSCTGNNRDLNQYTDDIYDSESQTQHTWFRQLSITEGRWLRPDPYLGSMDLGNPESINRYVYVRNSPVALMDRLGLSDGGPPVMTCSIDGMEAFGTLCEFWWDASTVDRNAGQPGGGGNSSSNVAPPSPQKPSRPCANVNPSRLDYSKNAQHIEDEHMSLYKSGAPASSWDGQNSQFYINQHPPDMGALWGMVKTWNAYVFQNATDVTRSGGNIVFTMEIPPSIIMAGANAYVSDVGAVGLTHYETSVLGFTLSYNGPTTQVTLIVGGDCTTVQTSHPGPPTQSNHP